MTTRFGWYIVAACGPLTAISGCGASSAQQQVLSALKRNAALEGRFNESGQLQELNARVLTEDLATQLGEFPQLEKLTLQGEFGDRELSKLPALPELKTLMLNGASITDTGLESLTKFKQLRELGLEGCRITDEGLKFLAELSELRHLNLNETQVAGTGLAHLAGLNQLEYLSLQETPLDFAHCPTLKGLSSLKTLHVSRTQVDGKIVQVLPDLPALERLYLDDTRITDDDLPQLAAALAEHTPKLKGLFFDRTQISDASVDSFEPLAKLSELSLVHIMNTRITFDGHVKLRGILPEVNLMSTH